MHLLPITTASDPGPAFLIFARDPSTPRVPQFAGAAVRNRRSRYHPSPAV